MILLKKMKNYVILMRKQRFVNVLKVNKNISLKYHHNCHLSKFLVSRSVRMMPVKMKKMMTRVMNI